MKTYSTLALAALCFTAALAAPSSARANEAKAVCAKLYDKNTGYLPRPKAQIVCEVVAGMRLGSPTIEDMIQRPAWTVFSPQVDIKVARARLAAAGVKLRPLSNEDLYLKAVTLSREYYGSDRRLNEYVLELTQILTGRI